MEPLRHSLLGYDQHSRLIRRMAIKGVIRMEVIRNPSTGFYDIMMGSQHTREDALLENVAMSASQAQGMAAVLAKHYGAELVPLPPDDEDFLVD